jgi:hypothetical protein
MLLVDETVSGKVLIELDEALAWARGERCIQVRLPDGTLSEMGVLQYRSTCEMHERLRAHRGKPEASRCMAIREELAT